jgi:hypothetical protein
MRNLLEYPVTIDEKIDAVRNAMKHALSSGGYGDIAPVALSMILDDLQAQKLAEGGKSGDHPA